MFRKTKKQAAIEEKVYVAEEPVVRRSSRKEHVFGAFLFGGLILVVIAGLAGIGFGTYSLWQQQSVESAAPSISALPTGEEILEEEVMEPVEEKATETKETMTTSADTSNAEALKKAQALDVIVMNGGGAKGVASEAAAKLKEAGFAKATIGNTTGDFTGTTVYTKKELEAEGKEVLTKLKTAYPTITYKEALASDKETQTASITVIFGK